MSADAKLEGPFCRDCMHVSRITGRPYCYAPELIEALDLKRNLVTGGYHETRFGTCEFQRSQAGLCGPEGKGYALFPWLSPPMLPPNPEEVEPSWSPGTIAAAIIACVGGAILLLAITQ